MKNRTIDLAFTNRLYSDPQNFVDSFNLVYATDRILCIERKLSDDQFIYIHKGNPIKSEEVISRINGLVIPPAW